MADKKALEMQHIFKSFGGVHALRDVSFTAYEGKVNVLMGENGAGCRKKSKCCERCL